jgi:uncharacterized repeat protein (TIGR01451 family)
VHLQPSWSDLAITKLRPTTLTRGYVVWTITVTNRGPTTADNVVANDQIPTGIMAANGGPARSLSVARLLQFAIDEKLTVPLELSRSEKLVLYKTLDDSRRTGRGFGGHPRLDELCFSLYDELADDLEERPADGGYV